MGVVSVVSGAVSANGCFFIFILISAISAAASGFSGRVLSLINTTTYVISVSVPGSVVGTVERQ